MTLTEAGIKGGLTIKVVVANRDFWWVRVMNTRREVPIYVTVLVWIIAEE